MRTEHPLIFSGGLRVTAPHATRCFLPWARAAWVHSFPQALGGEVRSWPGSVLRWLCRWVFQEWHVKAQQTSSLYSCMQLMLCIPKMNWKLHLS